MTQPPMRIDIPAVRRASTDMAALGQQAGETTLETATTTLAPPAATSPVGQIISAGMQAMQAALLPSAQELIDAATSLNSATQDAMTRIEDQDARNADMLSGRVGVGTAVPGSSNGSSGSSAADLDPASIDRDAREKAEGMLADDKAQQMMQQVMQAGMQAGTQLAQQLAQGLSQVTSQMGEAVGKVGEQVGQMVDKVAGEQAARNATEGVAAPTLDPGGGGFGAGGGAGAGGADLGTTVPAGADSPITPLTTSTALAPGAPPAGVAAPTAAAGNRMPMMPLMPMHGRPGDRRTEGENVKRDPTVFPLAPVFEPARGTEQAFGALPEIESAEPPFGTGTSGR